MAIVQTGETIPYPKRLIQYIPPRPSHICIVGEAPGKEEDLEGLPFIGGEGRYLTVLLRRSGIDRTEHYITNTVHVRPPKNDYTALSYIDIESGKLQLKKDLEEWKEKGLKTIIALGGHALKVLTGKDKITKLRGSFFPCTLVPGLKVCPTLHPGFLVKGQGKLEQVVVSDLKKFMEFAHDNVVRYPTRNIEIIEDFKPAIDFLSSITNITKPIVNDIETRGGKMTAYGSATDKEHAYVIVEPLLRHPLILKAISQYAVSTTPKIFHNALYDCFHGLHYYKFYYRNIFYDTMLAQRAAYPMLPRALDFCASLYTIEPYWKDEGKDVMMMLSKEGLHGDDLWKRLYIYNGKDCCLTYEIYQFLEEEIDAWGTRQAFIQDMSLIYPCLYAMEKGLLVDEKEMQTFASQNEKAISILESLVESSIGSLNVASPLQLKELLYKTWRLPGMKKDGKLTTAGDKLEILERFSTPYQSRIGLIMMLKTHYKKRSFYQIDVDPDGRMRYSLKITGAYTGRMASSASITGSGTNFQNQPEDVRIFYVCE